MTNREWLLNKMKNMYVEELAGMVQIRCEMGCYFCDKKDKTCYECKLEWLKSEHKEPITLSEAERVILENIDEKFQYICRDRDGELYIYVEKPIKRSSNWNDGIISNEFNCYEHLFQFITWEDSTPYNIAELLEEK